jgi:hypothetical protein
LLGKDREFDLGHIQPTGMFGRMMPNDAFQPCLGVLQPKTLDQRRGVIGVEIIQHQVDPASAGITFQQVAQEPSEIEPRAMPTSLHKSLSRHRFHGYENAACAATTVFVVLFGGLAGSSPLQIP